MLKNIKISRKLWMLVIPAIIALSCLLFILFQSINQVSDQSKKILYNEVYVSTSDILNADRDYYQAAVAERDLLSSNSGITEEKRKQLISDFKENVQQAQERIQTALNNIKSNQELYSEFKHPDSKQSMEQLGSLFRTDFKSWLDSYDVEKGTGDLNARAANFDKARENINLMTELLEKYAEAKSAQIRADANRTAMAYLFVSILVMLFLVMLSTLIIRYLQGSIRYITGINLQIAQGELSMRIDERKMTRDEIGQLCGATDQILQRLNGYVSYINEITSVLNTMAGGDMRIRLQNDFTGEFAGIKKALLGIVSSFSGTLSAIAVSSEQVDMGAQTVSSGAQALSQGATEQASTIEELSAAITDVSDQVRQNSVNVKMATDYVGQASQGVEESNHDMQMMLESMREINRVSGEISKIIKVIEDIAFQTNILALNAAVEAARAGEAGKGFAVVADEVRNLAGKSADAAKQTTNLIEETMRVIAQGSETAENTANALSRVTERAEKVHDIIRKIDLASSDQSASISQISEGLVQVSMVVQTNSAMAEENAASSEELSGQSAILRAEVGKFKL